MQRSNMRLRVSIYLTTLIAALVFASLFVACRNPANQNGNPPATAPSPSPSPTGSSYPELVPGDTIIVIKDGSVRIKVNKTLCSDDDDPQHPENPDKKFKCDHELGQVGIQTTSGPTILNAAPNDTVTIDKGTDGEIEVKGSTGKVSIKFKKAKYPKCPLSPDGEHCGLNHVDSIEVGSTKVTCVPADKCEVFVKKK